MEIYITDLETNDIFRFPMLPEKINVQTGTVFQSYNIMSVGGVKLPDGEELTGFSWQGMLPGGKRVESSVGGGKPLDLPYINGWKPPQAIQIMWSKWRVRKKKLRLLATETPINHDVYLDSYNVEYSGGFGDFIYNIKFVHAKELVVRLSGAGTTPALRATPPGEGNAGAGGDNPAASEVPLGETRPTPPLGDSYTVASGDSLWKIAQRFYGKGADYGKIFDANRELIEDTAKGRGKKSSDNGHWIFPGTVLTVPK